MFAILRDWKTPANRLLAAAHRGRPTGLLRGSWIADLVSLKKAVTLCGMCVPKWNPRANGYERKMVTPIHDHAIGECDGCNQKFAKCAMFLPREKH
ncbi:MAG: hypothetical protein AB7I42_26040 [Bradyrhizobium sp.]|uniref:hypothetical protein n=1 Tax=Bradyrhizobium sp. TaxID=376 RepID=UPI003D11E0E4